MIDKKIYRDAMERAATMFEDTNQSNKWFEGLLVVLGLFGIVISIVCVSGFASYVCVGTFSALCIGLGMFHDRSFSAARASYLHMLESLGSLLAAVPDPPKKTEERGTID